MTGTTSGSIVFSAVTIFLQWIVGFLLGFVGATALGIGNGWELLFIPLANAAGIVGIGYAGALMTKRPPPHRLQIAATFAGTGLGAVLIHLMSPVGFRGLLMPLILGIIAYHVTARRPFS